STSVTDADEAVLFSAEGGGIRAGAQRPAPQTEAPPVLELAPVPLLELPPAPAPTSFPPWPAVVVLFHLVPVPELSWLPPQAHVKAIAAPKKKYSRARIIALHA